MFYQILENRGSDKENIMETRGGVEAGAGYDDYDDDDVRVERRVSRGAREERKESEK